jgi:MFS transporter, FSR family, fosmidomycin resistance protein
MVGSTKGHCAATLTVYGGLHAVVDYTSAGIVITAAAHYSGSSDRVVSLFILYNVLAFGLQVFIGHASDHVRAPREVALAGGLLVVIALATLTSLPLGAIILVGCGNAFYHVGGGSIALNVTPRRATAPGFFVAPGALGLFAGTLAARYGHFTAAIPVVLIALLVLASYAIELPRMNYAKVAARKQRHFWVILFALLLAVAVRSLVGMAIVLPWKSHVALAVVLVVSVFAGKAIGGVLADRFGWTRVAVGSLLVSTPLLVLWPNVATFAILGMFLFNFTMPVTLTALSNLLPGRPGLSFGLTCLALLAGALPVVKGYTAFSAQFVILAASVIAIIAVYIGLTAARGRPPGLPADAFELSPPQPLSSGD